MLGSLQITVVSYALHLLMIAYQPPLWDAWSVCRFGSLIVVVDAGARLVAVATVSAEGVRQDGAVIIVGDQEQRRAKQKHENRQRRRAVMRAA